MRLFSRRPVPWKRTTKWYYPGGKQLRQWSKGAPGPKSWAPFSCFLGGFFFFFFFFSLSLPLPARPLNKLLPLLYPYSKAGHAEPTFQSITSGQVSLSPFSTFPTHLLLPTRPLGFQFPFLLSACHFLTFPSSTPRHSSPVLLLTSDCLAPTAISTTTSRVYVYYTC